MSNNPRYSKVLVTDGWDYDTVIKVFKNGKEVANESLTEEIRMVNNGYMLDDGSIGELWYNTETDNFYEVGDKIKVIDGKEFRGDEFDESLKKDLYQKTANIISTNKEAENLLKKAIDNAPERAEQDYFDAIYKALVSVK
jgi:hypothetical protein